jgi:hypothetical protein
MTFTMYSVLGCSFPIVDSNDVSEVRFLRKWFVSPGLHVSPTETTSGAPLRSTMNDKAPCVHSVSLAR